MKLRGMEEIRRSPVEVGSSHPIIYRKFTSQDIPAGDSRISEPSTVSMFLETWGIITPVESVASKFFKRIS